MNTGQPKDACFVLKATWWGDNRTFQPPLTTLSSNIAKPGLRGPKAIRQSGIPRPVLDSRRVITQPVRLSFTRLYSAVSGFVDIKVFL